MTIRTWIGWVLLVCFCGVGFSFGQSKGIGVGVVVGAPTGFSLKYWSSSREAFQGYLGGGFGGLAFGLDYLLHSNALNTSHMPFYYGPGAFLGAASYGAPRTGGTIGLGIRFVFGVDYLFPGSPFDLALEVGPALALSPRVGMGIEGGVAFRFYP